MARYLSTIADLKDYIFRKLGSEIHVVEITDPQWLDIMADSKKFFFDYSDWGTHYDYMVINPQGQREITLSDDILGIVDCFGLDDAPNVANIAYPSSTMYYLLSVNGGGDQIQMSAYVMMRQYLNTFKDLFREPVLFDFNTESKILRLGRADYSKIGFRAITAEADEEILNNTFFKMIVEMKCLYQWADNMSIKYDTESASIMGNGLKLNPRRMIEKADKLNDRIDEGLNNDEWGTTLMPRRLFS